MDCFVRFGLIFCNIGLREYLLNIVYILQYKAWTILAKQCVYFVELGMDNTIGQLLCIFCSIRFGQYWLILCMFSSIRLGQYWLNVYFVVLSLENNGQILFIFCSIRLGKYWLNIVHIFYRMISFKLNLAFIKQCNIQLHFCFCLFHSKTFLFFSGIHALARQWNAVIIGSTRKDVLIKPDSRKPVVGRGVLTRKDLAILMRGQISLDDGQETSESAIITSPKASGNVAASKTVKTGI